MSRSLRHIIIVTMLLFGVLKTSAQLAMPDTVCVGATKHYSVNDPSVPSTYTWAIDGVVQSTTTNEMVITWSSPGHYVLTVQEHSSGGCDGEIRAGDVYVIPPISVTKDTTVCSNGIPFIWNGITVNAAGDYPYTTTSSLGCDSTIKLHVTVNNLIMKTDNIATCASQLPYTWYGQQYSAAGTYTTTVPSTTGGCDTAATLNLTINVTTTSTTDVTICPNQLPYNWNGTDYNAPGTYTFNTTNAAGCDSIATLNLSINATITSTTDVTICPNQLPYNWNGTDYNAPGTYTFNTTNAAGCDSIATLNLSINAATTSTTDVTVCPNQLPYNWNGTDYNAPGTYTFNTTNAAGCDSIATLNLSINATTTSTTDVTVCPNQLPYNWNGTDYNAPGTYTFNTTNAGGCDSIATLNLSINATTTSTTDVTVCPNQLPYNWNGTDYNAPGTYTFNTTNAAGCDSIATLNLSINATTTSMTDVTVCPNQLPYNWNGTDYNAPGTYTFNTTNAAGCDSIATLNLSINATTTSTANVTVCPSQLPYNWNGTDYNAAGTYQFTTTNAAGCDSIATLNLSINATTTSTTNVTVCPNQLPYNWNGTDYNVPGTYTFNTTNAAGCDSIATLNLSINVATTSTTDVTVCPNQLPYNWNGTDYNAAGTYQFTTSNAAGCDSIATLNLSINATTTSTTNVTVCPNQLPYNWNGTDYNVPGTYTFNTTNAAGCDSIATLNLSINVATTSTTDVTVCPNQLPYNWNGTNYSAAGSYTFTTTNVAGCDSVATLNLSINATTTSTTDVTVCPNQLPYNWNGTDYNASGTYQFTTTNAAGCDSIATLNLSINATTTSTTDVTICPNQLPYNWNGTDYNASGTYQFTTTNAAGCDSIATLNLSINATTTSTIDVTICPNQLPYNWNGTDYNAPGTYTFNTTNAAGCDSIATLNLSINATTTSTTDVTVCPNQLPYNWNGTDYNVPGTYTFNATNAAGCDSVATLNLTINATTTSTSDVTVCSNQLPYRWKGTDYNVPGTYTFNATNAAGCDSIATLNLSINATTTSTTDVTVCPNQLPYNWNGTDYNASGTYQFTTTNAAGCDSIATLNLSINATTTSTTDVTICPNQLPYNWNGTDYNAPGTYTFNTTNAAGCDSIATLNLSINATTTSTIDVTVCPNQLPYNWNGTDYNVPGTYTFNTTNAAGCDSIATLNLSINATTTSTTDVTICPNQLPYNWNGTDYNASGTYTFNTTNAAGCDSIATLNLSINATTTSTTDVTICPNQLPYNWNGTDYNASGTYTFNTTNAAGCDSIATLNLSINAATTSTTNVTVCPSQLPYNWNGTDYNAAGTYQFTTTNAAGCDSVATLNLSINATTTSTTDVTVCPNQLPYNWNGTDYSAPGTYTFNTTNAAGCDSIATLNFSINVATTSTINVTVCSSQLPYNWNGTDYNAAGSYQFTTSNAAGCDSVATLNLSINATTTSTTDVTVCPNQLPYNWNGTDYDAPGTYTFNTTNAAGCDSIATLNFSINATTTSTTDVTVCPNQLPYNWNGTDYNAAGTYQFTTTNAAGCDSVATLNLTINAATTSTTDVTVCPSQLPYNWNGTDYNVPGTYTFNTTNAAGCDSIATLNLSINATTTSTTNVTVCPSQLPYNWNGTDYNASGTYTFNTTNAAGCDSIATLNLSINATTTSTTNVTVCPSQLPYNWNGTDYNASGTYTFNTTNAAGCDSIATLNLSINVATTSTTNITVCPNQLPYNWNGTDYNVAGTYTFTTTNAAGCDSIATLNLSINVATTSTTNITVCPNQLPYNWNGTDYNAAGTYQFTTTNAAGCDSIATLNLSINATTTSTTNVTVCPNQLPYNWNGTDYNAAGTYQFTTTNAAGCDSLATLNLSINATTTSTTDVTVCPNQLPYNWNGTDYNAAGSYQFTTSNAAGCDSIATLNLSVNATTASTTDVAACSNQLPYTWNGTDYNVAGTYTFTTTNAAGCDSVATLNLSINATTTSTTDVTVCSNQLPYTWNGTDYNVAGTYTFITTNAAGCDSIATLNLSTNATTTSTTNVAVCSNQLPYTWNGTDYNVAGTYTFTTTNAAGCDSVATLNLSISKGAHVDTTAIACDSFTWDRDGKTYTSGGDYNYTFANGICTDTITLHLRINTVNLIVNHPSAVCSPNSVDLTAASVTAGSDGGLNYTYWTDSDATLSLANPGTVATSGTYYIKTTSADGCSAIKPVVAAINPAPSLLVTNPAKVCAPGTVDLTNPGITAGSDPGLNYTYWTDAANTIPVADPKAVGASGIYYITAATTSGCTSTESVEVIVTVNKAAPGMRYPTVTTAPNTSVPLNARDLGPNYSYSWKPPVGLNFTDVKNPTFNYNRQTQYTITLTPPDSTCPTVDTLLVTIKQQDLGCKSKIDVPNAWSPNGDGHNDKLYPLAICIKELKYFRVFNRWGQLLFETKTIGQGWDGIFNGSPQVMDVYTWILEADGVDGVHYKLAGNSILMR